MIKMERIALSIMMLAMMGCADQNGIPMNGADAGVFPPVTTYDGVWSVQPCQDTGTVTVPLGIIYMPQVSLMTLSGDVATVEVQYLMDSDIGTNQRPLPWLYGEFTTTVDQLPSGAGLPISSFTADPWSLRFSLDEDISANPDFPRHDFLNGTMGIMYGATWYDEHVCACNTSNPTCI
jgi:hypothetical protein